MSTATYLLSHRVATGFSDERLSDVALRINRVNAHHLVVLNESDQAFVGLIKLAEVSSWGHPGQRILADLISAACPLILNPNDSVHMVVELFSKHQIGEAIILANKNRYVGLITMESVLEWRIEQWQRAEVKSEIRDTKVRSISPAESQALRFRQAPIVETPDNTPSPESSNSRKVDGGSRLVLLVEDHEASRTALKSILARRNFNVIAARSMAEALSAVDQHKFVMLISDIGLPDGSGFELMTMLRQRFEVGGISVSGHADFHASKAAGFRFHLTKPLKTQELDAAIRHLLFPLAESSSA